MRRTSAAGGMGQSNNKKPFAICPFVNFTSFWTYLFYYSENGEAFSEYGYKLNSLGHSITRSLDHSVTASLPSC